MRIAFAVFLSFFATAAAFAAGTSSIHVGLIVTGNFASPLVGTWDSIAGARNAIYHFEVGGTSGVFYELVSVPPEQSGVTQGSDVAGTAASRACDLRVAGLITSVEKLSGETARSGDLKPSYEMRYSIQAAEVVTSSVDIEDCERVAADYMSEISAAESTHILFLSRMADGSLIDSVAGTKYTRTAR